MNSIDLDPGIQNYTRHRRILHRLQLRNEIMFTREQSNKTDINFVIVSTNTTPGNRDTLSSIRNLHTAAGYDTLQFHYLILENGQVWTGLEPLEKSQLVNGEEIVVGLVGGLTRQGTVPIDRVLSNYTHKQSESLMALLGTYITCNENVSIVRKKMPQKQGVGSAMLNYPDLLKRVIKRYVLNG